MEVLREREEYRRVDGTLTVEVGRVGLDASGDAEEMMLNSILKCDFAVVDRRVL